MKLIAKGILYVLALMSIAAGLAKVLSMTQEVSLFADAGLGVTPMLLLGIMQVAGGVFALVGKVRMLGLILIAAGFAVSVLVVAMTGNLAFAAVSVLPVLFGIGLLALEIRTLSKV